MRKHLSNNAFRIALIGLYIDKISPTLFTHINIVLSHRGVDLHNLNKLDTFNIKNRGKTNFKTNLYEFHSFLRDNMNRLKSLQKSYSSMKGKYNFDDSIKRAVFLRLLFEKRRLFRALESIRVTKSTHLKSLKITLEQAKDFLLAGNDPVVAYMAKMEADEEAARMQLMSAGSNSGMLHQRSGGMTVLLLQMLTADDCARALCEVSDAFRKQRATTGGHPKKTQLSVSDHPVLDVAPKAPASKQPEDEDLPNEAQNINANVLFNSNHSQPGSEVLFSPSIHDWTRVDSDEPLDSSRQRGELPSSELHHIMEQISEQPQLQKDNDITVEMIPTIGETILSMSAINRRHSIATVGLTTSYRRKHDSLDSTVEEATKVLKMLSAASARRPSSPRPSSARRPSSPRPSSAGVIMHSHRRTVHEV